jgi:branched-chain amino acid transport system substrate-binding protein
MRSSFVRPCVRLFGAFVAILAVVVWLSVYEHTGCGALAETEESAGAKRGPIKIGFMSSTTGFAGADNQEVVNGFQLYMDQIGHTMAGRKADVIVENDETNPAKSVAKLHKLLEEDKVNVISGYFFAAILRSVAPVIEAGKTPTLVSVAAADDLTQRKRGKWLIRSGFTSSQVAHPMGEYAAKTLGFKKIVTICPDYLYGYEVAGGFQHAFEENGGQIIQKLWVPLDVKDATALIKEIRPDADAVFFCLVGQQTPVVLKQYKLTGPHLPIVSCTPTCTEDRLQDIGESILGAYCASPYISKLPSETNKHFVHAYNARFGKDPGMFAVGGYCSAAWIENAVQSLKGDVSDKEKLLAAMQRVHLENDPRGPVKMDSYGNIVTPVYISKVEKVNGKYQNTLVHTYPAVSQFWKWDPEKYMELPAYSKNTPPCTHCQ